MIARLPEPEPEPEPEALWDQDAPAAMTPLAAALRRRRAARAPPELRAKAVTGLQACADAASAAASQVQIRALDAADIAAVLALNYDRLPSKVCTEALALRLQSSAAHCLVAAETLASESPLANGSGSTDETPCSPAVQGFVLIETSRGSADVVLLAVRPDCERQGVGRALLSAALANAAAAGCNSASLSVQSGNAPAVRLYRSLGFNTIRAPNSELALGGGDPASGGEATAGHSARITMQWCL